jgi:hypothetical protein
VGVAAIAVTGRVIVQPIVNALLKHQQDRTVAPPVDVGRLERRIEALEERLGSAEHDVASLIEDRDFYRQLNSGSGREPDAAR